jgi:hypothetical protein
LTPEAVDRLRTAGAEVQVESCDKRCFQDDEYKHVRASELAA